MSVTISKSVLLLLPTNPFICIVKKCVGGIDNFKKYSMKNILTLIAVVLTLTCYSTTITVTNPVGGETFIVGQTVNITWTWTQNLPKVKIELYENNAAAWRTLADSIVNTGSYSFVASGSAAQQQNAIWQSSIRITKVDSSGVSGVSNPFFIAFPPLVARAGNDATLACGTGSVQIGGSPAATGGIVPYTYLWTPATGLSNANVAKPLASPTTTTTYVLTVIDSIGTIAKDTVLVNVLPSVQVDAGTDIVTCSAAQVALNATVIAANYCNGSAQSGATGTDTLIYTQNFSQRPSLAGNFLKSYRNQMLYTAAELNTLLGGAKTIKGIEFQIAQHGFASSAQVQNYRISLGNTSQDSLTGSFNNTLTTVLTLPSYQPFNGWNYLSFNIGFVWDGVSNVIVEICSYNPTTFGSQPNSAECSSTAFSSYCYALSNSDLCGINGAGTTSTIRPNIKLRYCDTEYVPYTLNWTPSSGLSNASIANPIANPVANTTYTVSVIDSNGCSASDTVRVNVNSLPVIDSVVITDVHCYGDTSGSVCAYVSNGIAPYSYSWSNGTVDQCIYSLSEGPYTVMVHDFNGCSVSGFGEVKATSIMELDTAIITNVTCNGTSNGAIDLTMVGSLSDYTFQWSNFATTPGGISGLIGGWYFVNIMDTAGCHITDSFNVIEPTLFLIDTVFIISPSCNGGADGAIDVTALGGIPPYSFLWGSQMLTTEDINGLTAGTYTVTITDNNLCQVSAQYTLSQPTPVTAITSHTDAGCNGYGSATAVASGGQSPYEYSWSNGFVEIGLTSTQDSLQAGSVSVTITDAAGCAAPLTYSETITQLPGISVSITNDGDGIYPDTLGLDITGGCAPYQYLWSNASPNNTTEAMGDGTYIVTVLDCQGCSSTASITLSTGGLAVGLITNNVSCTGLANGAVTLVATGGTSPYQFSIDGGVTFQSSNSFINLGPGNYQVVVNDAASGSVIDSFAITEPSGLVVDSILLINPSCYGITNGSACFFVSGGTGNYVFSWTPNVANSNCGVNLGVGFYTVTATDANACSLTSSVVITQPSPIQTTAIPSTADCDVCNGTLSINVNGGAGGLYDYFLNDTTPTPTCSMQGCDLLCVGNYNLIIRDANGCLDTTAFTINGSSECVWPGDANYDGVADNNDLLPIGLAYGNTGPARSQIDIGWSAHNAANWADTLINGANYKHIDCDGSGLVNADDTTAIIQNYGFIHAKTGDEEPWRANAPELYVRLLPDTTRAGDTLYAQLMLGDGTIPAANVYGLAFTVNYDPTVVDSPKTRAIFGTSWLGSATDKISIAKDLPTIGQIKCAVTRIDHTTRGGDGQIGVVTFVITTDNINGKNLAYFNNKVWISDVLMIDNNGIELPVNAGRDSTLVEFEPLSVGNIKLEDNSMTIQPNPAANAVQLSVTRELVGAEIRLTDLSGRLLKAMPVTALNLNINTSELAGGIYLVQAISAKGTITKRLIIAR